MLLDQAAEPRIVQDITEHASVMITEAVVKDPGTFPDCGQYLGDLFGGATTTPLQQALAALQQQPRPTPPSAAMVTPPAETSVTATDHRWPPRLALGLGLLVISGCQGATAEGELEPVQQQLLGRPVLQQLVSSLDRCNASVEAFPDQPEPWRDRSLVQTLMGLTTSLPGCGAGHRPHG